MQALLGIVAAIAAAALLVRALHDRRRRRASPGGGAASAIRISQFDEIDAVVALRRCACRGRFAVRGEGPVAGDATIRRVRIECRECGREQFLYFDMAGIAHSLGGV
jgi:hypothetical protein